MSTRTGGGAACLARALTDACATTEESASARCGGRTAWRVAEVSVALLNPLGIGSFLQDSAAEALALPSGMEVAPQVSFGPGPFCVGPPASRTASSNNPNPAGLVASALLSNAKGLVFASDSDAYVPLAGNGMRLQCVRFKRDSGSSSKTPTSRGARRRSAASKSIFTRP